MQKRFIQREEAKCNFCSNWFALYGEIKFGLNICQQCIYKALNTNCFKLPSPEGNLYQVYLAKRHLSMGSESQNPHLQKIDEFMHLQIKTLLKKWEQIANFVKKRSKANQQSTEKEENWKKVEFILKNDCKRFQDQNRQTVQQVIQDTENVENMPSKKSVHQKNQMCTPLREKKTINNISIKCIDFPNKYQLSRDNQKKSARLSKNLMSSSKKSTIFLNDDSRNVDTSPSPFSLQKNSRVTSRSRLNSFHDSDNVLESNREFQDKIQITKSCIGNYLEDRNGKKLSMLQNIMKQKIFQIIQNTTNLNKCIQLVSYKLPTDQQFDMDCYLANLQWEGVQVVKFVKVGLTDVHVRSIMASISQPNKKVETLVLTNNNLTQQVCQQLLKWEIPTLKNIYLGKNSILPFRVRNQITKLRKKYRIFV